MPARVLSRQSNYHHHLLAYAPQSASHTERIDGRLYSLLCQYLLYSSSFPGSSLCRIAALKPWFWASR